MTGYPLRSFFLADVLGEAVYTVLLVTLGLLFSDQLEYIGALLGVVGPWLMGVFIIVAVGVVSAIAAPERQCDTAPGRRPR